MRLNYLYFFLIILAISFSCRNQEAKKKENNGSLKKLPNIVIILADDMGYGDAGCYNSESKIPTPNIDRLATNGILFTDAHSTSSVCSPTRYSLLTGRYAWRSVLKKTVLWPWDRPLIKKGQKTIPVMLKQFGYHTACIGKWHLGWSWATKDGTFLNMPMKIGEINHPLRVKLAQEVDYTKPMRGGPLGAGFDYYFGDDMINQPPYVWIENNICLTQPTEPFLKKDMGGSSQGPATPGWEQNKVLPLITEEAVRYIKNRANEKQPFFLYFPLTAPHVPILPTEKFIGKSTIGKYGDFVCQVDDCVRQVVGALKKAELDKNTLVIFTSDNGSYQEPEKGHMPNGLLRGKKTTIYEGGHRIPFIVQWPEKISKGSTNDQLISMSDIFTTCMDIVGKKLTDDAGEDSRSFLPALYGNEVSKIRKDLISHSASGEFAIREGSWKLIFAHRTSKKTENDGSDLCNVQLYNLENDISETTDLSEKYPNIVERMTALLEKHVKEGRSTSGAIQKNDTQVLFKAY